MNNELTLFDDNQLPQEQTSQELFDYEQIPTHLQASVLQKTAEIQWLLKRSTADIIKIGKNLLDIKADLPHGMFTQWVQSEFGMNLRAAQRFMLIARKLGNKNDTMSFLSGWGINELMELASAPDEIIDQVAIGELPPTKEAIKQAKLEAKLDKEAKIRAEAEKLAMQTQLFDLQENRQSEIDTLTQQYDTKLLKITEQYNTVFQQLKDDIQELEANSTPKVEFIEVPKEVLPLSVKNNLESLQNRVNELTANVEAEKKTIPPEAQKQMEELQVEAKRQAEDLQKQLDKLKEDRRLLDETNKSNQEQIDRLNSQLKVAIKDRITSESDERIRQEWRSINSEARSCLMRLLGSWPTSLDVQSFESDDWERLSQLKSTLKRVLEECDNLNYGGDDMVVEQQNHIIPSEFVNATMPVLYEATKPVIGIPPEYKALFEEYQQRVLSNPQETLLWNAQDHNYPHHMIEKEKHIQFTKELLSSEVDRRIQAALEAMKRTLGTWEG